MRPANAKPTDLLAGESLAADAELTLFQKILLATDGTVTELLALHAGRPIHARKLLQEIAPGAAAPVLEALAATPDTPILHRTILLCAEDEAACLHADSYFIIGGFSEAIQRDLNETDLPIGLLWRRERLEMHREIIDRRRERDPGTAALLQVAADAWLLSRTYLVFHGRRPLGMITEKFAAGALR